MFSFFGESNVGERKLLLVDFTGRVGSDVRIAIMPDKSAHKQQVFYISPEEFTKICKEWMEQNDN